MFILFCCLKPIHQFTLDGQDCLQSWEGRQYCPRSCWGTMEGNTDLENDMDGGVVVRGWEQDGVGGAVVRNCTPLRDPAFCLLVLLSQQPPERWWGPYPGPLPAESSQSGLFTRGQWDPTPAELSCSHAVSIDMPLRTRYPLSATKSSFSRAPKYT